MEGPAELLWGQSSPGHLSDWQGAVLLSGARKPHVDGRHHGPNRMGRAEVRHNSSVLMSGEWDIWFYSQSKSLWSCAAPAERILLLYAIEFSLQYHLDPVSCDTCSSVFLIVPWHSRCNHPVTMIICHFRCEKGSQHPPSQQLSICWHTPRTHSTVCWLNTSRPSAFHTNNMSESKNVLFPE